MEANTDTVENSTVLQKLAFDTKTAKRVAWSDWSFTIVAPFEIEVCNLSYGYLADDHTYRVMIDEQGVPVSCTCPGYEYHHRPKGRVGKHMLAVATVGGPTLLEAARAFSPNHEPTGATETTTASKETQGRRRPQFGRHRVSGLRQPLGSPVLQLLLRQPAKTP